MTQRNDFYVYGVYLKESDKLFYIGKGTGKRYKSFGAKDRSKYWFNFVKEREFYSTILYDNLTNKEALEKEKYLIDIFSNVVINKKKSSRVIEINPEILSKLYYVDPSSPSGLRWKTKGGRGPCTHSADDVAGSFMKSNGYWTVVLNKRRILAHRVVYAISKGNISEDMYIDHIDGNRQNNSINNLREVTPSINARNKSYVSKNNLPKGMHIARNVWNGSKSKQSDRLVFVYRDKDSNTKTKSISIDNYTSLESAINFMKDYIQTYLKDILLYNNYTSRHFNLEE